WPRRTSCAAQAEARSAPAALSTDLVGRLLADAFLRTRAKEREQARGLPLALSRPTVGIVGATVGIVAKPRASSRHPGQLGTTASTRPAVLKLQFPSSTSRA